MQWHNEYSTKQALPPSDEGGGKTAGFDGGRDDEALQ